MTHLPAWSYQGTVPFTGDLSVLEFQLHSGRVAAAELGYTAEPLAIVTEEAMLRRPDGDPETDLITAEQAEEAGLEFSPTMLRFRMDWAAEGEAVEGEAGEGQAVEGEAAEGQAVEGEAAGVPSAEGAAGLVPGSEPDPALRSAADS